MAIPISWSLTPARSDASSLMIEFASRAFRRPVEHSEVTEYISHVHALMDEGTDLRSSIQIG